MLNGNPVIFFDGPAGSQVPQCVADAVSGYLTTTNANHGGPFATAVESDQILGTAHQAVADFLGVPDPETVAFGPNMTTLTFALSRAVSRTWNTGDEIIVTQLDHDANVTPWVLAARDAGVTVKHIAVRSEDCTLNLDDFESKLSNRTRLVAVGYASNITGSINPIKHIIQRAHDVKALAFIDAVHYAPHGLIDVPALDCDFLTCSAYKFFGPHVGVLWGRRELLEELEAYKLRPAGDDLPGKWMTGTQNHEGIAGAAAAIEYLADLGRSLTSETLTRRGALETAFDAIADHERTLATRLLDGLADISNIRIWGIIDPDRFDERVPTVSFTHSQLSPQEIGESLANQGIFVWPGNHYALPFTESMNLEPDGTLRVGLLHYNAADEVDRLIEVLARIARGPAQRNVN